MAANDFSVAELAKAMDTASDDIKREVAGFVQDAALAMVNRLQQRYPAGPTGNLRAMVFMTQPKHFTTTSTGVALPAKRVRATAPHIHIWQEGTRERFDATRKNARRGRMPAGGRVFESTASEVRATMFRRAQDALNRNRNI